MVEHTPGPWKAIDGREAKLTDRPEYADKPADFLGWIVVSEPLLRVVTMGNEEPDARLIAAAPELLSALEFARQVVKDIDGLQISHGFWDYIDAAIRKARGEVQP